MLWLQGWDQAPAVAQAARQSWQARNPGWTLQALDRARLGEFLPAEVLDKAFAIANPAVVLSDLVRLELLYRHGGVWADATTICAHPLDRWLPQAMPQGFFAFDRPSPKRMIANWFLASEKQGLIVDRWRRASWRYWEGRQERDNYFWHHIQFAKIYKEDAQMRALWDATPKVSARHRFHFGPESDVLKAPPRAGDEADLSNPPVPVFKLTHKFATPPGAGSLFERLCAFGNASSAPQEGMPLCPLSFSDPPAKSPAHCAGSPPRRGFWGVIRRICRTLWPRRR